jgi:heat shock protein 1/8
MVYAETFDGAIGIDLGTTYSCVAVWENDRVEIIANDQGNRTTPSQVAFTEEERIIGDAAKNQGAMNPENTIFDAKRLIGRRFDEKAVQKDMAAWPFKVTDNSGKPKIQASFKGEQKEFDPEEISSMVLTCMKDTAEAYLGKEVTKAVITVPAYFNDAQRNATKDAGAIAGLEVLRIINEPTAASIAYGLDNQADSEKTILIFDLGGGTFDVSLLTINDGVFTVKATAGDTHLGGEDFDDRLLEHFKKEMERKKKWDISGNARALRRVKAACERAKRTLSSTTKTTVEIDSLYEGEDFSSSISRAKFEELCSDLFTRCLDPVSSVLADANVKKNKVDEIVLVGGSTRIPKIQALLQQFFDGKELNKTINPDEAVAYGAAVQAALLTGMKSEKTANMVLLDVVPLSLGIEMQGGIMATVVPRNTTIPCIKKSTFTTAENNQTMVQFPVYEGERPMCKDNNLLGQFELTGLPALPKGVPELETTFEIDANGLLKVTAKDKGTGRTANIAIKNDSGRLGADDIERMLEDAKKYKQTDEDKRLRLQAKDELNSYITQMQSTIEPQELRNRLLSSDVTKVEDALSTAMEWLDVNDEADRNEIATQKRLLERVVKPIMSKLWRGGQREQRGAKGKRGGRR